MTGSGGVHVIDIADRRHPRLIQTLSTNGYAEHAELHNDILYVADGDAGLTLFDATEPATPTLLRSIPTEGYANHVALLDEIAAIANGPAGTALIDLRDRPAPRMICAIPGERFVLDVALSRNSLLTVDRDHGLTLANVDVERRSVQVVGQYLTPSFMGNLSVQNANAYVVSTTDSTIHMLDVANLDQLQQIASVQTLGTATNVVPVGETVYIADGYGGIQLLDAATNQLATIPDTVFRFGEVHDLAVLDSVAFLAGPGGIRVVDIADPLHPQPIACFCGQGAAYRLAVQDHLIYAAGGVDGLRIIDIADLAQPALLATVNVNAEDVVVNNGYAYVAGGADGLYIIDALDPNRPKTLAPPVGDVNPSAIAEADGIVYLVDRESGLYAMDVHDPVHPIEIARYDTPDFAASVSIENGRVYLTDRTGGLFILQ